MFEATRPVTLRDFVIFQLKLLLDGLKDVVVFQVAIVAVLLDVLLDLISGSGKRPRLFYRVLRHSERFDRWLSLNGAVERLESGEVAEDGLFGASRAGSDDLLGKLEQLVRGGDGPLEGPRRRRTAGAAPDA